MSNTELYAVKGGAVVSIGSASWLNAFTRTAEFFFKIGKSIGSSFRFIISGRRC